MMPRLNPSKAYSKCQKTMPSSIVALVSRGLSTHSSYFYLRIWEAIQAIIQNKRVKCSSNHSNCQVSYNIVWKTRICSTNYWKLVRVTLRIGSPLNIQLKLQLCSQYRSLSHNPHLFQRKWGTAQIGRAQLKILCILTIIMVTQIIHLLSNKNLRQYLANIIIRNKDAVRQIIAHSFMIKSTLANQSLTATIPASSNHPLNRILTNRKDLACHTIPHQHCHLKINVN